MFLRPDSAVRRGGAGVGQSGALQSCSQPGEKRGSRSMFLFCFVTRNNSHLFLLCRRALSEDSCFFQYCYQATRATIYFYCLL